MPKFSHSFCGVSVVALMFAATATAADAVTNAAWQRLQQKSADALSAVTEASPDEGRNDSDVTEISFAEFLAPARDGGLEFTARLRSLAGKRVRVSGFMVRQPVVQRGAFILAPIPVTVETACYAAEIPSHAVRVHAIAGQAKSRVAYRPGRIALTGVLELGPRREADGRFSAVRLVLDETCGLLSEAPATAVKTDSTAASPTS